MALTKEQQRHVAAQPIAADKALAFFGTKKASERFLAALGRAHQEGLAAELRNDAYDTAFEYGYDNPWFSGDAFWGEDEMYNWADHHCDREFDISQDIELMAEVTARSEDADATFFLCRWMRTGRRYFLIRYDWKDGYELTGWWLEKP